MGLKTNVKRPAMEIENGIYKKTERNVYGVRLGYCSPGLVRESKRAFERGGSDRQRKSYGTKRTGKEKTKNYTKTVHRAALTGGIGKLERSPAHKPRRR